MGGRRYPLDTTSLVFFSTARDDWRNIFRHEASLSDAVDPAILQQAVDDMTPRFPWMFTHAGHDAFWFFLEENDGHEPVRPEGPHPLVPMSDAEASVHLLRILYGPQTIAVECFHGLTDGTGLMVFFGTLLARYLSLKHAISIPAGGVIKDLNEAPRVGEMADAMFEHAGKHAILVADEPSYIPRGTKEPDGLVHVTKSTIDTKELLEAAHRHKVSLASIVDAAMIRTVMDLQDLECPRKRQRRVNVTVAADLRRLFETETLRNFTMVVNPGIDPRLGDYGFEEICTSIHHQIHLGIARQNMAAMMAAAIRTRMSPAFRMAPLPLKSLAINAVFDLRGENCGCMSMSNLGVFTLPQEMAPYVTRMETILGPPRNSPYNCVCATYAGKTHIDIVRTVRETRLEERFFSLLGSLGIAADVSVDGVAVQ